MMMKNASLFGVSAQALKLPAYNFSSPASSQLDSFSPPADLYLDDGGSSDEFYHIKETSFDGPTLGDEVDSMMVNLANSSNFSSAQPWDDYADENFLETFAWSPDMLMRYSPEVSTVYCIAYTIVFVLGIVGNSFVVAVVLRSPRMRTVTNYFIVNLALADILVLLFCLPATLLSNLFIPWVLGLVMCKTVSYLQGVAVSASINTLVAVSADRFLAICYPFKCQMSRKGARRVIIVIWLFSLVIAFPWAVVFTLHPINPKLPALMICEEDWPDESSEVAYFVVANLCLCYLIPLFIITACYLAIWLKVWKRSIPGASEAGATKTGKNVNLQLELVMQRSKLKVAKMMIVVVVIFVISWLPLYCVFARVKLGGSMEAGSLEEKVFMTAAPIAQWLGASNSCINPVLYAFFNKKYRKGFEAIVKSKRCCGVVRYEPSASFASAYYNRNGTQRTATNRPTAHNQRQQQPLGDTQCEYFQSMAAINPNPL